MISILLGLVLSFTSLVTIIHESLLSNLRLIQVPGQCFWNLIKGNAHAAMIILVYHNFSSTMQENHKVLETRNFKNLTSHQFCLPTLCEFVQFTNFVSSLYF